MEIIKKIDWNTEDGIALVQEEIVKIASRSSRTSPSEFEDIVQDLWLNVLPKRPGDLKELRNTLKNLSIDLFRTACRSTNGIVLTDFHDPASQKMLEGRPSPWAHDYDGNKKPYCPIDPSFNYSRYESPENYGVFSVDIESIIDMLGEKERKYLVAKGYLAANIESFKDEYMKMFEALSDEGKDKVMSSDRPYSDDVIVKVFLGIRTGTNSGTIRSIKNNIKKAYSKYLAAAV